MHLYLAVDGLGPDDQVATGSVIDHVEIEATGLDIEVGGKALLDCCRAKLGVDLEVMLLHVVRVAFKTDMYHDVVLRTASCDACRSLSLINSFIAGFANKKTRLRAGQRRVDML